MDKFGNGADNRDMKILSRRNWWLMALAVVALAIAGYAYWWYSRTPCCAPPIPVMYQNQI